MKSNLYKANLIALIVPILFFIRTLWEVNLLIQKDNPSEKGIFLTVLDFNGGTIFGLINYLLFFVPVFTVGFEYAQGIIGNWELIRCKTRDVFAFRNIRNAIKYSAIFVVSIELMKIIAVIILVEKEIYLSSHFAIFVMLDLIVSFLFYYRIANIYLIIRTKINSRIISFVIIVLIYFCEYVVIGYIFINSPFVPSYIMIIPFKNLFKNIGFGFMIKEIGIAIIIDIILTIAFLVIVREKDML